MIEKCWGEHGQKWMWPELAVLNLSGTNSRKLNVDSMIFGWTWPKMAMAF